MKQHCAIKQKVGRLQILKQIILFDTNVQHLKLRSGKQNAQITSPFCVRILYSLVKNLKKEAAEYLVCTHLTVPLNLIKRADRLRDVKELIPNS